MKRIDIIGALKIASEKGKSLDEIKNSLLSAGYGQQDIDDSMQAFSQGASPYEKPQPKPLPVSASLPAQKTQPSPQPMQTIAPQQAQISVPPVLAQPAQMPAQSAPQPEQKPEKAPAYLLIAIVISAIIVAGLLGYVIYSVIFG